MRQAAAGCGRLWDLGDFEALFGRFCLIFKWKWRRSPDDTDAKNTKKLKFQNFRTLGLGGGSTTRTRLTGVLVLQRAEFRDLLWTLWTTQS